MNKTLEERVQILEDREAIIKLKARYVNFNDGGWKGPTHTDPQAVADMFVVDGVWDGRPSSGYAKGHAEVKALFEAFGAVPFIIHYVTNPLIDIDGDSATGHWHALVTMTVPGEQALWTLGMYHEEYLRTAEGWRFKTLRFETAATAPYELGWAKVQHSYTDDPFKTGKF
jgi:hypothetical protein